jgi:glycosyltransferase involved in cell wall biosynthesis
MMDNLALEKNFFKVKVSVIVAVYNGESFIQDCLNSLLDQTYKNFEVVFVNDASTDKTKEILERVKSDKIKVAHLDKNLGCATARNMGAKVAKGEYLAILDVDDCATPTRLDKQVRFLDGNPEYALIGSYIKLESTFGSTDIVKRPLTYEDLKNIASWNCPIANTSLMIRSKVFAEIRGYPDGFRHGEDYRIIVEVMRFSKVANLPEVLVIKRETGNGLTFGLSLWKHIWLGWNHRAYAIKKLGLTKDHYLKAVLACMGIFLVRIFKLNRESFKNILGE